MCEYVCASEQELDPSSSSPSRTEVSLARRDGEPGAPRNEPPRDVHRDVELHMLHVHHSLCAVVFQTPKTRETLGMVVQ